MGAPSGLAAQKIAIQGELGSNSHVAALAIAARDGLKNPEIVACALSAEVFEALDSGSVNFAVLPIENSLHGSVAEHYDLLLAHDVSVAGESFLRVRHNLIAAPGVRLQDIRQVLSHPVALSQCRRWLREHSTIAAMPFYDTAGSVKHLMQAGLRDTAAIAPELAAREHGAELLIEGIEDHAENYTRFYVLRRGASASADADKLSLAFSVEHRPGTLLQALGCFRSSGLNLTRIESRPVPGKPWEYVFFVDLRFQSVAQLAEPMRCLADCCQMIKDLGRYRAA